MDIKFKDLFETKERQAEAVLYFRGLQNDPGWKLLVKIVQQNINALQLKLETGEDEESVADIKATRKLLKAHRDFIETPQNMIDEFTGEKAGFESTEAIDPYPQITPEGKIA